MVSALLRSGKRRGGYPMTHQEFLESIKGLTHSVSSGYRTGLFIQSFL